MCTHKQTNPLIDDRALSSFEARYKLSMPKAYREFILTTNGCRPVPTAFPIKGLPNNPRGVIQAFFGINATIRSHDLAVIMSELTGLIPPGLLPIACTDGDDWVCIDLRNPSGPIRFWDRRSFWGSNVWTESDLYPVAEDFEDLLKALR